ncbi:MAG TPA: SDR family oxidoreductase [Eoetvoesiella sp.]
MIKTANGADKDAGRLQGKKALITGAAAGIGAATAAIFCQQGAEVILLDRDAETLAQTISAIQAQLTGARLVSCVAELGNEAETQTAVSNAIAALGGLDILVNNAARRSYGAIADIPGEDWRAVIDVNVIGTANVCKAAMPALRQSGRASIVNVSSCYAVAAREGMATYDVSKAGILAMTRALACEEAVHGIRANAICPGPTLTTFQLNKATASGKSLEELKQARNDKSLLKRWATSEEIAWPILWLASDEASFITGATLMVDGGLSII